MKFFLTLLLCCLLAPLRAQPNVQLFPPDSPLVAQFRLKSERYGMPAVAVGPFIFVLGGNSRTGTTGSIERIDTRDNSVVALKTELTPRYFHGAEAVGSAIYVFGGIELIGTTYDFSSRTERFDTVSGKITEVAPLPAILRTPASVEVGGKIYVIGGSDGGNKRLNNSWIYEPATDKWTSGAPMKVARECDVVSDGTTIYAIGGFDGTSAVKACEAYDIATNTWRDLPDLPVKTSAHHLALVGDSLFSFGDYDEMSRVQRFDLKSQTWTQLPHTGYGSRRHNSVCSLGSKIYVIGGNIASSASYLDEVQVFDADKLK